MLVLWQRLQYLQENNNFSAAFEIHMKTHVISEKKICKKTTLLIKYAVKYPIQEKSLKREIVCSNSLKVNVNSFLIHHCQDMNTHLKVTNVGWAFLLKSSNHIKYCVNPITGPAVPGHNISAGTHYSQHLLLALPYPVYLGENLVTGK